MHKNLSFLYGIKIAHRGLFDNKKILENTKEAFQKAIDENMAIELDLQLLKDDTVIVFHDDSLKRLTGIDKPVSDCTWEEIKKLTLLGTDAKISTFEEVLNLVNGKVPLDIELKKCPRYKILLQKILPLLDSYQEKGIFFLKSFDPRYLKILKNVRPSYPRGLLASPSVHNPFAKTTLFSLITVTFTKPDFIAYSKLGIQNCHLQNFRKKAPLLVWTIRNKEEFLQYQPYADGFILEDRK